MGAPGWWWWGGGGFRKNGLPSPRAGLVCLYPMLMGGTKTFLKNIPPPPFVYVQNDQRVMGILLRYVCWGTHQPPPPPRPMGLSQTPHGHSKEADSGGHDPKGPPPLNPIFSPPSPRLLATPRPLVKATPLSKPQWA